ncbi:MAG: anti-sigma factor [Candidatus Tumulicola sp.]
MNERSDPHDMLDDVAVYALGALSPGDVRRVRAHIASCTLCAEEYASLRPAATAIGLSAETIGDARACPSTLLKPRIMAMVRSGKTHPARAVTLLPRRSAAARGTIWPAYLVAAACIAIAIVSSMWNVALTGQLKQTQQELARATQRSSSLADTLTDERSTLSDLLGADAKHYVQGNADVVTRGSRAYIAMHDLAEPPRGKVYQAWTLPKGSKKMVPSLTFEPDAHGDAVIALPSDARATAVIAVSLEPEGGSKQPTTKPILVVPLT